MGSYDIIKFERLLREGDHIVIVKDGKRKVIEAGENTRLDVEVRGLSNDCVSFEESGDTVNIYNAERDKNDNVFRPITSKEI